MLASYTSPVSAVFPERSFAKSASLRFWLSHSKRTIRVTGCSCPHNSSPAVVIFQSRVCPIESKCSMAYSTSSICFPESAGKRVPFGNWAFTLQPRFSRRVIFGHNQQLVPIKALGFHLANASAHVWTV